MATLRPIEERDAKGNTLRMNPAITFKQDREIRKVVGRHDFHMIENPDWHEPITVQVQNNKLVFFYGTPENSATRTASREITVEEVEAVAPYIVKDLRAHPMKVREVRPTVYEVKIATVGDVEVTQVQELADDNGAVTVTPVAPARWEGDTAAPQRGGAPQPAEVLA